VDLCRNCDWRHAWMLGQIRADQPGASGIRPRFPARDAEHQRDRKFPYGFLFIVTLERLMIPPSVRGGVLTGVLGGYTTFSTFEMETLLLAEGGEFLKAALYVVLSVGVGFAAAFGGAYIARNL
jgi:CrcB-like protein, Camphor Resistance (CrcB)